MLTSIIVSTYNQPSMVRLVLTALDEQHYKKFEVVIADDGSTEETADTITNIRGLLNYELNFVWHKDMNSRAAAIGNKSVARNI